MSKIIPKSIIQCYDCGSSEVSFDDTKMHCSSCNSDFAVRGDKIVFTNLGDDDVSNSLDKIKYFVKKNPKFYIFLMDLISPVYRRDKVLKNLIKDVESNGDLVAINLGAGNSNISDSVSNIDIFPYENVNISCDIGQLPLKDNSVDVIFNIAVLEHVPDPEKVVSEIYRVLKPGGIVYSRLPFIQGFHASPWDFGRRTREGMKVLYKEFEIKKLNNLGGPTSGMLWVVQEWLAIVLSLGSKRLHMFWFMLLLVLTWPIKFLDVLLVHHPLAHNITSGFILLGEKPLNGGTSK